MTKNPVVTTMRQCSVSDSKKKILAVDENVCSMKHDYPRAMRSGGCE